MGCCIRKICSDICNKCMNLNAHLFWTLASPHCKESMQKKRSSTYVRPKKGGGGSGLAQNLQQKNKEIETHPRNMLPAIQRLAISHRCGTSVLWLIFLHFVTLFYSILLNFSLFPDLTQDLTCCHCYAYHWGKTMCNTKRCPNRNIWETGTHPAAVLQAHTF